MIDKEFSTTVIACVTALGEAFGRAVSKQTFKSYEGGLDGLSPAQIKLATKAALQQCRFMPPPAELREMLFVRLQDRAVKSWMAFERAVRVYGYLKTVNFDDPLVNATVRALGGWEACCDMPAVEFDTFLQKRFQETYCSLARAGISAEQAAPLLGWADRENQKNGFDSSKPVEVHVGLPPLANVRQVAIDSRPADLPRVEFQKP